MKKILIVTPFYRDDISCSRPAFIAECLKQDGTEVLIVTSDFCHYKKEKITIDREDVIQTKTLSYNKNTSFMRFASHLLLSFSMFYEVFKLRKFCDTIYITAPFALTASLIKIFTRKKIVVDIVDFWPVSLPFKRRGFPFNIWEFLNRFSINQCDVCMSTSKTFLNYIDNADKRNHILLGAAKLTSVYKGEVTTPKKLVNILYIGNIGHLYDFSTLINAVVKAEVPVKFHLVGVGDFLDELLGMLKKSNIEFSYYGSVYEKTELEDISRKCDFGFNGYKNTNASYSYKSSTYFSLGLPIINSMKGDLEEYVINFGIGYNYESENCDSLVSVLNRAQTEHIDANKVSAFFNEYLDFNIVKQKVLKVFKEV
ncbi:Glycosyltransferase WbuB [Vibrio crassostreae]|nr:Glycosyltransferase WbuB [Vibrio crassostreae]CAK3199663.1 Glycosyltransferase WbuB [Vibrio crassostreae]CAK3237020.1 Glycosyltransferase WbuB [Vibrio crassostreae]CAK3237055.1 Glycosyltransferase WbuB [Vibrio crassostreae]CAK3304046.1 Glycosyltransferase WbuB [Vibrio crassostreae]